MKRDFALVLALLPAFAQAHAQAPAPGDYVRQLVVTDEPAKGSRAIATQ